MPLTGTTYIKSELGKFLDYTGTSSTNTTATKISDWLGQYAKNGSDTDLGNLNSGLYSYYTSFTPQTITTNSSTEKVAMLPSIRLSLFENSGGSLSLSGVQYYYNQEKKVKDVRYKDISSNDDATHLDDYDTLTSQYLDKVFYNSDDTQVYTHYLIPDTTVILTFSLFLKPKNSAALTKPYNLQGIYSNVYYFMGNAEPQSRMARSFLFSVSAD